jgi:hypothetical protein
VRLTVTGEALRNARFMPLAMIPATVEAKALVEAIAADIETQGIRRNVRRSEAALRAHRRAVGATVADLLVNWQKGLEQSQKAGKAPVGGLSYRSSDKGSFTGHAVSARHFADVMAGLKAVGYLAAVKVGWSEFLMPKGDPEDQWGPRRYAARIAPADKLLNATTEAGIAFDDLRRKRAINGT